jgi:hypothetical protein
MPVKMPIKKLLMRKMLMRKMLTMRGNQFVEIRKSERADS